MMLERLYYILQSNCQIDPTRPLVVGVSGGPDSVCLLDVLTRLDFQVVVAHFNHMLRPEAVGEARRVEELAGRLRVPFLSSSQDVDQYAQSMGLSVEEAARELRYKYLFAEAQRCQAQAVAVGHTADDQVETVLMHLLRGAGMDGLKGMAYRSLPNPWSADVSLVRPLLAFWREEIMYYLAEHGLQASMDASNLDTTFFRNRLRHEVIPTLEQLQPQLRRLLWRTANVLQEEQFAMKGMVEAAWTKCVLSKGEGYLSMDVHSLCIQPLAVQRRLLRGAIAALRPGVRDVDFETIERGLSFIASSQRKGQCCLVGGLFLVKEDECVWLASSPDSLPISNWPQIAVEDMQVLNIPGEISFSGGWVLQATGAVEAEGMKGQFLTNDDAFQAWFDAEMLPMQLMVRRRRPGDRLKPLGMEGHSIKISDVMVNLKIPRRARQGWPLVCTEREIMWVPGCRQGLFGQVTGETRFVVQLVLAKVKSS